jgi:phosphoribosylformylglycinamidine synthase
MGMMPHPERFLSAYNHPQWTKNKISQQNFNEQGAGQKIFINALNYFS